MSRLRPLFVLTAALASLPALAQPPQDPRGGPPGAPPPGADRGRDHGPGGGRPDGSGRWGPNAPGGQGGYAGRGPGGDHRPDDHGPDRGPGYDRGPDRGPGGRPGFDHRPDGPRGPDDRPGYGRGPDRGPGGRPGWDHHDGRGGPGFDQGPGWANGRHGWRDDRRYDWRGWRGEHRDLFRAPRYLPPRGYGAGYRAFAPGYRLQPFFYSRSYWIDNPYAYRLPPAEGPYRWVRYYDDVLLVDLRSGLVVDAIQGFFL